VRIFNRKPPAPEEQIVGGDADDIDRVPVRTFWQLVRRRFMRHRMAVIALFILITLIVLSVAIPMMTGSEYQRTSIPRANGHAVLQAPLGYDEGGRNIFLRLMRGTQVSLTIGFAAVLIIVGIGTVVGGIAGYVGGIVDNLLMRVVDVVLTLPVFFVILMIVALFGRGDARVVIIAIGITGWTLAARLIRAEFLRLREADFVLAARALGASPVRIAARHMLPSALAPLIVAAALGVADSVVVEAALSFLGFGIQLPEASLGNMLNHALTYLFRNPERMFYPGFMIVLIVLAASFLGDGLRDALDPRQKVET
jgi:ABC-type dipeptide/oligopeptide/nickel transport system permease subunit